MAWGHPSVMTRNRLPYEAGGGGGGAGGARHFAPEPVPGGGMRIPGGPGGPPGSTIPPHRRGARRGFQTPFGPRKHPWRPSQGLKDEMNKKANFWNNFFQWWIGGDLWVFPIEDWMRPEAAVSTPSGWVVPPGWTQCPTPNCPGTVTHWWWSYTNATCAALALCPPGQAFPNLWPAGTEPAVSFPFFPARDNLIFVEETSPGVGTLRAQFTRPANEFTSNAPPYPSYEVGVVLLPEQFADPWADPWPMGKQLYGTPKTGAATGLMSAAKPGVELAPGGPPGGVPIVHVPTPPRPPDKEKKEPPWDYGPPGQIYGALTEAADAAACYVEAKGGEAKGGTRSKLKQAWALANDPNAPPFDPGAFAQCMAIANAKDAAIGRLSNAAAKAQNRSGSKRPGGYRGGGWGTRMH